MAERRSFVLYICLALFFISTGMYTAQTTSDPIDTLTIGDAVDIVIEPDEVIRYDLAIAVGDSFEFNPISPRDSSWSWSFVSPTSWTRLTNLPPMSARVPIRSDAEYQLEIVNTGDSATSVQFELVDVPTRPLVLGERYALHEDDPENIEFEFSLTEPQAVALYANGRPHGSFPDRAFIYSLEQIHANQTRVSDLVPFGELHDSAYGFLLEPGDYRLVVMNLYAYQLPEAEDEEPVTELPYVEIRPVGIVRETITIGQRFATTANMQPVFITIDLEGGRLYRAEITSDSAHVIITDADGNSVDSFGHGAVGHRSASPRFVVPEDGQYTMQIFNPRLEDAMNGDFTITSDYIEFPTVDRFDVGSPFDIVAGEDRNFCNYVVEDIEYRLQLRTIDGEPLDGAIEIEVIQVRNDDQMPEETILQAEMRDTAMVDFTFTATNTRFAVTQIRGLEDVDAMLEIDFGYADEDNPYPVSVRC